MSFFYLCLPGGTNRAPWKNQQGTVQFPINSHFNLLGVIEQSNAATRTVLARNNWTKVLTRGIAATWRRWFGGRESQLDSQPWCSKGRNGCKQKVSLVMIVRFLANARRNKWFCGLNFSDKLSWMWWFVSGCLDFRPCREWRIEVFWISVVICSFGPLENRTVILRNQIDRWMTSHLSKFVPRPKFFPLYSAMSSLS